LWRDFQKGINHRNGAASASWAARGALAGKMHYAGVAGTSGISATEFFDAEFLYAYFNAIRRRDPTRLQ
jgi:hypothetical protein